MGGQYLLQVIYVLPRFNGHLQGSGDCFLDVICEKRTVWRHRNFVNVAVAVLKLDGLFKFRSHFCSQLIGPHPTSGFVAIGVRNDCIVELKGWVLDVNWWWTHKLLMLIRKYLKKNKKKPKHFSSTFRMTDELLALIQTSDDIFIPTLARGSLGSFSVSISRSYL